MKLLLRLSIFFVIGIQMPFASALVTPSSDPAYTTERELQKSLHRLFKTREEFPFWKNVGFLNDSTAIYLGNGFVLTAGHVGAGTFSLGDGSAYEPVEGTTRRFRNPDGSQADLCVFQVRYQEGDALSKLSTIPLGPVRPARGSYVLLMGAGSGNSNPAGKAVSSDMSWNDDYRLRWGLNRVEHEFSVPMPTYHYLTPGYSTLFSDGDLECQATPGDSGGAVFVYNHVSKRWELGGIILAVDSHHGRAEHGNQTYIADLTILPEDVFAEPGLVAAR